MCATQKTFLLRFTEMTIEGPFDASKFNPCVFDAIIQREVLCKTF